MIEFEIPDWVPAAVQRIAKVMPCKAEVAERLLTDERMQVVWRTLRGRTIEVQNLEQLKSWQQFKSWGVADERTSLPDQACTAFYATVAVELSADRVVWTREKADKFAESWNSSRDMCSWIAHYPMFDEDFQTAAKLMTAGFERHASMLEEGGILSGQANPAYFVERSSGDDDARGRARALAKETHKIFGTFLCGTVATVVSIALKTKVSETDVRRWCHQAPDLLAPSVSASS